MTRSWIRSCAIAFVVCVVAIACSSSSGGNGGDTPGEGKVPQTAELSGYWHSVDDEGTQRVIHMEPTDTSGHPKVVGKSQVYHIWKYDKGRPHTLVQNGTYVVEGGI